MAIFDFSGRSARLGSIVLGVLCVAHPAAASTILDTGIGASGPAVFAGQYEAQGWSQTQSYSDVDISVGLFSWTPGNTFHITAYLTNSIGDSSTPPALDSTSFSGETPDSTPESFLLFSGLTLGPGTYYVTLAGSDSGGPMPGALWPGCAGACPVASDTGVALLSQNEVNEVSGSQDTTYAPGSTFVLSNLPLNLTIAGDALGGEVIPPSGPVILPTNAPEPSSLGAIFAAIAALLLLGKPGINRRRLVR